LIWSPASFVCSIVAPVSAWYLRVAASSSTAPCVTALRSSPTPAPASAPTVVLNTPPNLPPKIPPAEVPAAAAAALAAFGRPVFSSA
jgi:hypothetical protein